MAKFCKRMTKLGVRHAPEGTISHEGLHTTWIGYANDAFRAPLEGEMRIYDALFTNAKVLHTCNEPVPLSGHEEDWRETRLTASDHALVGATLVLGSVNADLWDPSSQKVNTNTSTCSCPLRNGFGPSTT